MLEERVESSFKTADVFKFSRWDLWAGVKFILLMQALQVQSYLRKI
jgi:hypothetical protein